MACRLFGGHLVTAGTVLVPQCGIYIIFCCSSFLHLLSFWKCSTVHSSNCRTFCLVMYFTSWNSSLRTPTTRCTRRPASLPRLARLAPSSEHSDPLLLLLLADDISCPCFSKFSASRQLFSDANHKSSPPPHPETHIRTHAQLDNNSETQIFFKCSYFIHSFIYLFNSSS